MGLCFPTLARKLRKDGAPMVQAVQNMVLLLLPRCRDGMRRAASQLPLRGSSELAG
jgi:hypothetical protein